MNSQKEIISRIYLMQHITRFNNLPIKIRQNIAEHSNGVSLLCLLFGKEISDEFSRLRILYSLNYMKSSVWANVHDYEETVSTDLPYPLKKKLGVDIMSSIDNIIQEEIQGDYSKFGIDYKDFLNSKSEMTYEYQLLKMCDYLELLIWTYSNKNQFPESNYNEVIDKCKDLISSYEIHKYSNTVKNILEADEFTFFY